MIEPSNDFVLHIRDMIKEKTGKEPSYQEAWEGACNLIGFFDLLLKVDTRNKLKKKKKHYADGKTNHKISSNL